MRFVAVVCGADPLWAVPSVTDDPLAMLERLTVAEPAGEEVGGADEASVRGEGSHTLLVTRPSWLPAMRRLVTLLRAHDPSRHYAVLVTDRLPLASALVAEHVNALDLEPGTSARLVDSLLRSTESGVWVRRPGKIAGGKVGLWDVIRSTWAKQGYIAHGAAPVTVARADDDAWVQRLAGVRSVSLSGEVPEVPADLLRNVGVPERLRDRDVPPGTKLLTGKQRSFEFAGPRWSPDELPQVPDEDLRRCDSCGSTIVDFCPFCHAQWGETPARRRRPQLIAEGDRG